MRVRGADRNAAHFCAAPGLPLFGESHHPRLDHNAARTGAADGVAPPSAAITRQGGRELRAPAARVEPAASASLPAQAAATDGGAAAGFARGDFHLSKEGQVADVGARPPAAGSARLNAETVVVSVCHASKIGIHLRLGKTSNATVAARRGIDGRGAKNSKRTSRQARKHRLKISRIACPHARPHLSCAGPAPFSGTENNVQTNTCGLSPRGLKIRFILPSSGRG
ncbi:hypothetical protein [Rhodoblastus sp.]|uniref:hypothetical protein n=1 Tax=Rhodoblastus sp. TaxID=1962975 RepID=UPI00261C7BDE|nr:hypothetical protein [Rhodoblastus sp.]